MSRTSRAEIDRAWAAGFYEGEGSISACGGGRLILSIGQTEREPLDRFERAMPSGAISGPKRQTSPLSRKPFFQFQANGEGAMNCIRILWPNLSRRRQTQALRALTRWMFRTVGTRHPRRTAWEERKHGIREYAPET
jgi:hypothetical protein